MLFSRSSENFRFSFDFFENAWTLKKGSVRSKKKEIFSRNTALLQLKMGLVVNLYLKLKCNEVLSEIYAI